ncbi:MAG: lipoyl(octanoyl) transferase LipB [Phycisphaerales bacterium]|jgi:lipoyl(octanoyl) transferase|nr:lipoyl(octanoyl) transferase LipB [Phycisphaerales bacterium]
MFAMVLGIIPRFTMSCTLKIIDLGSMEYEEALLLQRTIHKEAVEGRELQDSSLFNLLLLEHFPPVITMSKRPAASENLIATPQQVKNAGVCICKTDRGGDITYHGPGQLVGYPIFDLNALSLRLHSYMRFLEGCIIDVLDRFGIAGSRDKKATGVWVDGSKICAMGVRVSKWISMHGFALNVSTNLDHFDLIVPCGLTGRSVTSMQQLLGNSCPSMDEVKKVVSDVFTQSVYEESNK